MSKTLLLCSTLLLTYAIEAQPDLENAAKVDRNVNYGMYSGLALLMDVYYPEEQWLCHCTDLWKRLDETPRIRRPDPQPSGPRQVGRRAHAGSRIHRIRPQSPGNTAIYLPSPSRRCSAGRKVHSVPCE